MTTYEHRCMIVAAGIADEARELAAQLAGPPGEGMWVVPVYTPGDAEPTHYISSGMVDVELIPYLEDAQALGSAAGMELADAEALLAQADISGEEPFAALDRLELELRPGEEA